MIFYAMEKRDVQSVHEVIKIGDTPADMLEGRQPVYNHLDLGANFRFGLNRKFIDQI